MKRIVYFLTTCVCLVYATHSCDVPINKKKVLPVVNYPWVSYDIGEWEKEKKFIDDLLFEKKEF